MEINIGKPGIFRQLRFLLFLIMFFCSKLVNNYSRDLKIAPNTLIQILHMLRFNF